LKLNITQSAPSFLIVQRTSDGLGSLFGHGDHFPTRSRLRPGKGSAFTINLTCQRFDRSRSTLVAVRGRANTIGDDPSMDRERRFNRRLELIEPNLRPDGMSREASRHVMTLRATGPIGRREIGLRSLTLQLLESVHGSGEKPTAVQSLTSLVSVGQSCRSAQMSSLQRSSSLVEWSSASRAALVGPQSKSSIGPSDGLGSNLSPSGSM